MKLGVEIVERHSLIRDLKGLSVSFTFFFMNSFFQVFVSILSRSRLFGGFSKISMEVAEFFDNFCFLQKCQEAFR